MPPGDSPFAVKYIIYNHHHHISVVQLGHLLTRSGLTYPEVSSKVYHGSFCQSDSSVSLPWVIYFQAFYLHVVILYRLYILQIYGRNFRHFK